MSHFKKYWSFYWPLAVTGSVLLIANQFQNGVLGRYPDAARELAVFAYATSLFHFLQAMLNFTPQMVNVMARSHRGVKVTFQFILAVSGVLTVLLLLLAYTPPGRSLVGSIFGIRDGVLDMVMTYLRWLSPLIIVNGLRNYLNGLMIQAGRTGMVTVLNAVYLAAVIGILLTGYRAGWRPVTTLALAQVAGAVLHLALIYALRLKYYRLPEQREADPTFRDVFAFFWPVAATSAQFALSRPIIYSFISRLDDPEPKVAALRVAFVFAVMFHNPINQFRHLFITFGREDEAGVRRFMTQIMTGVVAIMLAVALTPLSGFVFGTLLGVDDAIVRMARQSLVVLAFIPVVVTWRNYFHSVAMLRKATGSMALGGICRTTTIFITSLVLLQTGWLNHVTGAVALVLGFGAETLAVMTAGRGKPALTPEENAG